MKANRQTKTQRRSGRLRASEDIARDSTEHKRAEEAIQSLARFPSENPNPVLRIGRDGTLLYANEASAALLRGWQLEIGKPAPSVLQEVVSDTLTRQIGITLDTEHDQRIISFFVAPVVEAGYSNLYGRDVTEHKRAEEKLRSQAALLESVNDAIVASDAQYRLTAWNAAAESLYGWKAEQVLGRNGLEIVRTEWPAVEAEEMKRIIAEAGRWRGEATQQRKDGTRFPVEVSSLVLRDDSGQITGYVSVIRDITERKLAEEALREAESRYRSVADFTWDWEFWLNLERHFVYVSPSCERITGYAPGEFIGSDHLIQSIAHPEDVDNLKAEIERAFTLQNQTGFDFRIVRRDGIIRWVSMAYQPITDPTGTCLGIRGSIRDIADRKRAEETLLESELKFRTLFDRALDGILIADMETRRFLMGNSAICQMLGYTHDELSGIGIDDIHPLEHLPYVVEQFNRQARGEIDLAEDIPIKRKDGSVFYADINSAPVTLSGQTYMMGVFRDITERKQAEEEIKKQLDELQRWHNATLGRETRILDLKREVNELLGKAGQPPRYPSAET